MKHLDNNSRAERKPNSSRQKDRAGIQAEKRRRRHRKKQFDSYQEDYAATLRAHLESGESFLSFAGKVKVESRTLYRWIRKHPEFRKVAMEFSKERSRVYGT